MGDHRPLRRPRIPDRPPQSHRVPSLLARHRPGQGLCSHREPRERVRHQVLHTRQPPQPFSHPLHRAEEGRRREDDGREDLRPRRLPAGVPHRACPRGRERQGRRVPVIGRRAVRFYP